MYCYTASLINRFILNLYPPELSILVDNEVKWRMLSHGIQNRKSLLVHIELSLQNTQVTLFFGVMHTTWYPTTIGWVNRRFPRDCQQPNFRGC